MRDKFIFSLFATVLLANLHDLAPSGMDGNLFLIDYPQSLSWYVWSLCNTIIRAIAFYWIWQLAKMFLDRGAAWTAFAFFFFELKEIGDYLLYANQLSATYEVICLGGITTSLLLINADRVVEVVNRIIGWGFLEMRVVELSEIHSED